ncbi:ethanolamine utilization microcompartment protein EutL [Sporomusa acidovorans]|uniref:Ethanolamine utilization protein EutL n=1 Tax=Sporomusa acidovorans (strain ATCC 49682 / DSM 3132 / Mol) TaxID=1123286 RepID=A0ABZ3J8T5_SPOA4|nr:ethanolamine utilization microcompartment protein EutL [Sporomusa acidovorans]OZC21238.1 ethanolamine utilization protein EutL [Sporomusa acidovorans DSM 3132]SDE65642.1 ethanolamine utilization protein EutL [Sporomusa acidovorans]
MIEPIKPKVLAVRLIPNVAPNLVEQLGLKDYQRSVGMITANIDDSTYTALDEATKKAEVEVVYAKSFYAGAAHASGPRSGEIIGILAAPNPAEVRAGVDACIDYLENEAFFYTCDGGKTAWYPHTISRTGSYLSKIAKIEEGEPLAYLIAPPLEAVYGIDAALKAAEVEMKAFYGPPTETNFGGALLTGSQSACRSACEAFQQAVIAVAENALKF